MLLSQQLLVHMRPLNCPDWTACENCWITLDKKAKCDGRSEIMGERRHLVEVVKVLGKGRDPRKGINKQEDDGEGTDDGLAVTTGAEPGPGQTLSSR